MVAAVSVVSAVSAPVYRSELEQNQLAEYPIDLTQCRVHDAMHTNLPNTAANDDMALITGTPGTDAPTLQGVDFGGTSTDEKCAFAFALPPEYDDGQTILVRVRGAMVGAVSDNTALVGVEVWKADGNGGVGSNLQAASPVSINSLTPADKDFVVTPTGLTKGNVLIVRVAFSGSDVGNAAPLTPEIQKLSMMLDIRG